MSALTLQHQAQAPRCCDELCFVRVALVNVNNNTRLESVEKVDDHLTRRLSRAMNSQPQIVILESLYTRIDILEVI